MERTQVEGSSTPCSSRSKVPRTCVTLVAYSSCILLVVASPFSRPLRSPSYLPFNRQILCMLSHSLASWTMIAAARTTHRRCSWFQANWTKEILSNLANEPLLPFSKHSTFSFSGRNSARVRYNSSSTCTASSGDN